MTATREPAFVRETLAWCNRQRAKKGKKPLQKLPRGVMNDPLSCPCGAATGLEVDKTCFYEPGHYEKVFRLPLPVAKFVSAFDEGLLPQYVRKAKS